MWWRNTQVQQALHLTDQQIEELERIFHNDIERRIADRRTLAQLETQFTEALNAGDVGGIEDSRLIDRIAELRIIVNVRRAMMLMAMYRTLSQVQRAALMAMHGSAPAGR